MIENIIIWENMVPKKKKVLIILKEKKEYMNKERINFMRIVSFYFIFLIFFVSLFLISGTFGSQKSTISKENENYLPSISLIGVLVSKDTSSSVAVLKNEKTGKIKMLSIGESISNLKLIRVFENRIILQRGEKTFQIFLGRSNLTRVAEKIQKESDEIGAIDETVDLLESNQLNNKESSQLNNNLIKKEFIRTEVQKRIEREWPLILEKTRFIPNNINGEIRGFKIIKFPERTILSEIGIRENDIIKEVDGVELNDFATLFELFNKFQENDRFEVSIERNGKLIRILYVLK